MRGRTVPLWCFLVVVIAFVLVAVVLCLKCRRYEAISADLRACMEWCCDPNEIIKPAP